MFFWKSKFIFVLFVCFFSAHAFGEQSLAASFRTRAGELYSRKSTMAPSDWARSKLHWKDIRIQSLALEWKTLWQKEGYLRLEGELGSVSNATFYDLDYFYPKSSLKDPYLFSKTHHPSGDGFFLSLKGAIGPLCTFPCFQVSLAPVVGISFRHLHFMMVRGKADYILGRTLTPQNAKTPFCDAASTMKNDWCSVFFGLDGIWKPCSQVHITGKFELHLPLHLERGYWNLRDYHFMMPSFGSALLTEVNFLFPLKEERYFGIQLGYERWRQFSLSMDYTYEDEENYPVRVLSKSFRSFYRNYYLGFVYTKSF